MWLDEDDDFRISQFVHLSTISNWWQPIMMMRQAICYQWNKSESLHTNSIVLDLFILPFYFTLNSFLVFVRSLFYCIFVWRIVHEQMIKINFINYHILLIPLHYLHLIYVLAKISKVTEFTQKLSILSVFFFVLCFH